jgi:putative glutamine amidotransferase
MKRPVIGITSDYNKERTQYLCPYSYAEAVEKAGGLPLLLPYRVDLALVPQYVDLIDGMLFSGGDDLDPCCYGEECHPNAIPIDPLREKFERALLAEVERRRVPTLGICLGSQLINTQRGGSMIQFLPEYERAEALEHRRLGDSPSPRHPVALEADCIIAKLLGKTQVLANSSHKQAMKKIGRGLRVIARAPDGVVEAMEDPDHPLMLAVQWHPERLADEDDHLALFKLLVEKAGAHATR